MYLTEEVMMQKQGQQWGPQMTMKSCLNILRRGMPMNTNGVSDSSGNLSCHPWAICHA